MFSSWYRAKPSTQRRAKNKSKLGGEREPICLVSEGISLSISREHLHLSYGDEKDDAYGDKDKP